MKLFLPVWLATPTTDPEDVKKALELFKTDPFHYFNKNGLATDPVMQGMAADIYQLLQVIALGVLACSVLYSVIKWGMTLPGKKQEGIVSVLGWKLFMVAFIAAFVEIVSILLIMFDQMAAAI